MIFWIAVLHGLPVWPDAIEKVHLTRSQRYHGRIRNNVHMHVSPLGDGDVTELDDIAVTSLARTLVDLARTVTLGRSVAAGDQALRADLEPTELPSHPVLILATVATGARTR